MRYFFALLVLLVAAPAIAAPAHYVLDGEASVVAFTYTLNGQPAEGRMPVAATEIVLDFERAANSTIAADIDVARANAGLFFATDAMKSKTVLDTAKYPIIRFRSTTVTPTTNGATLDGEITIRGVTRPIKLDARLFRQRGTDAGDRSRLSVLMTGAVSRSNFGAGGYPSIVGDEIGIKILARITRED